MESAQKRIALFLDEKICVSEQDIKKNLRPPVLLQDPDWVLCSALVGEVKTDINPMKVVRLEVLLSQNRLNRGDSLPEAGAGTGRGRGTNPRFSRPQGFKNQK